MAHMTPEAIIAILNGAIRDGHAVTLSRGGQPIIAEPYTLTQDNPGKLFLTYLHAGRRLNDARHPERNWVGVFTDVVDLGRSLEELDARDAGVPYSPPDVPRSPGRPRLYDDPRDWVRVQIPLDLIAQMDAITTNRTAFIEQAIRAALSVAP